MDDRPDQDPMVPSSRVIVVPSLLSQRRYSTQPDRRILVGNTVGGGRAEVDRSQAKEEGVQRLERWLVSVQREEEGEWGRESRGDEVGAGFVNGKKRSIEGTESFGFVCSVFNDANGSGIEELSQDFREAMEAAPNRNLKHGRKERQRAPVAWLPRFRVGAEEGDGYQQTSVASPQQYQKKRGGKQKVDPIRQSLRQAFNPGGTTVTKKLLHGTIHHISTTDTTDKPFVTIATNIT
ncbi:hypothetical protein KFK09_013469 [Dendrobium nobile]|uniref:Uncharacterized protein n=1 Tax=Dendrobium nobile TaxID=94219 RepID=A0A8T3B7I2_DENNO|nr:hypothetical protein KFK09_013469 [Dendrobium nobile]